MDALKTMTELMEFIITPRKASCYFNAAALMLQKYNNNAFKIH